MLKLLNQLYNLDTIVKILSVYGVFFIGNIGGNVKFIDFEIMVVKI